MKRFVLLGLFVLALPAPAAFPLSSPSRATVEIKYRVLGQAALPPEWHILVQSPGRSDQPEIRIPVRPDEPVRLELAPGSTWEVAADLDGFWVPRKTLEIGQSDDTARIELELWPLGAVSGSVKVQKKTVAPPREILVKTVAAPAFLKRPSMPPGVLTCPVDKRGAWSCSLPAGKFDLVITAPGFTPHYRWSVEVPPGKTLPLGAFQLERGSSVAGWVAVEGGAIDPGKCVARLSLVAACGADADALVQMQRIAVERPVSQEGFLQLTGLAPGIYALEVSQPGLAPARVSQVRVDPERETFLPEPLLLTQPLALEIAIVPPLDERGEPWRAQVIRRAEAGSLPVPFVFDGAADMEGRAVVGGQPPGWYQVTVLDSRGNRVHSEPERHVEASTRQTIELRRVVVDGLLKLGSEPLRGTLWFGGRSGFISVKMEADEEGRFAGILQDRESGSWIVDVEALEPKVQIRTRAEIRPDSSGKAAAVIELPDTRVFGRVVDAQGRPVGKAYLLAASEKLRQTGFADAEGRFDFRGLPPGSLALFAKEDSRGQSERTLVSVAEDGEVGPVELRLRAMKRLPGTVSSSRGPVAGALVRARARPPAVGEGQASTGPDGSFFLEMPANVNELVVAVSAPGYGTQVVASNAEKGISLALSETAGDVVVALPDAAKLQRENRQLVLFQNGMELPMTLLRGGTETGSGLRFASLAPGWYSACLAALPVTALGAIHDPKALGEDACESGQLSTGGTLALTFGQDD